MKHIFTDDTDWVVAESMENLKEVYGRSLELDDDDLSEFRQLEDDAPLSVNFEGYDGEIDYKQEYLPVNAKIERTEGRWAELGYPFRVTATVQEWCEVSEVGDTVASTEF